MDANHTLQDWRFLAELAEARIIVVNKRRGNEGTKLTIKLDWKEIQLDDVKSPFDCWKRTCVNGMHAIINYTFSLIALVNS